MSLRKNVVVGLAGSIGTSVIGLAVVPVYIRYLGLESYGLIGFLTALQALFQLVDLGIAPTLNREVAIASITKEWTELRGLLHTLSVVYWVVAGIIAALVVASAYPLANHWLNAQTLSKDTVAQAVMLIGVVIGCRWPIALYQAVIIGSERFILNSTLNVVMAVTGAVGAIVVLEFVNSSLIAFFAWQAVNGLSYALVARVFAWRSIGKDIDVRFDLKQLARIWKFSTKILVLTIFGLVFSQLDKVVLTRMITLQSFGQYTLATVVAGSLGVVISPFYNAIYPRLTARLAANDTRGVISLYRMATYVIATLLFSLAAVLVVFGEDLLLLWTHNRDLAQAVAPLVALLSAGTAIHGVMYVPHALQLAENKAFIPIVINGVLIIVMVPVIVMLTTIYGAFGGALAWLILHAAYMLLGTWLTHRFVIRKPTGYEWLAKDVGPPLLCSIGAGLLGSLVLASTTAGSPIRLGVALCTVVASVFASIAMSSNLRSRVAATLKPASRLK